MHGVVGEIQHPGLLLVAVHEADGFVGEDIGEEPVELLQLVAAVDHVVRMAGAEFRIGVRVLRVIVPADEEAEELVEAAGVGVVRLVEALVPFADERRRIPDVMQFVGDRALVERQPELGFLADVRVELMAEAGLRPTGQHACAGRAAVGAGDVARGAAHAGRRERVDVRRRHGFAAVHADVPVAEVIGEDDQDVGPVRGECRERSEDEGEETHGLKRVRNRGGVS